MKIRQYGLGGVYIPDAPSTNDYSPLKSSGTKGSGKSSKADTPLKESIIGLLKENSLPNDHRGTLELALGVLSKYDSMPGMDLTSSEYIALLQAINDGKVNQDVWKKASDYIYANDTAEEAALDSNGNMFIGKQGEDGKLIVNKIRPEEYSKYVEDGWTAMSNAGLLTERANNDDFRWNMDVISGINTSTNSSKIAEKLRKAINELPETQEGYMLDQKGQLQSVLAGAQMAMAEGADGIYKYASSTDRPEDLQAFYNYAWHYVLSDNDKNYMKAKIATMGGDPTNASQLMNLVTNSTAFYTHQDFKVDLDDTATKLSRIGIKSDKDTMIQHELMESYSDGANAGTPEYFRIAPSGSSVALNVVGQNVGPVMEKDAKTRQGAASVGYIMDESYGVGAVSPISNVITFGDQLIDRNKLDGLMYTGTNMYRVEMPAKRTTDGSIVPDLDLVAKCEEIKNRGVNSNETPAMINTYLDQVCPGARYDATTDQIKFPPNMVHPFLTFGAVADKNLVDFDTKSRYLTLDDGNGRDNLPVYESAVTYGTANHAKNAPKRTTAPKEGFWNFTRNRLYKGNVFIPVDITAGSRHTNQEYIPKDTHTNITGRVAEMEREKMVDYSNPNDYNW